MPYTSGVNGGHHKKIGKSREERLDGQRCVLNACRMGRNPERKVRPRKVRWIYGIAYGVDLSDGLEWILKGKRKGPRGNTE